MTGSNITYDIRTTELSRNTLTNLTGVPLYKCQDKYAQKFSYKYVQFILLSILSRFLGKGAEADKIFLLL